MLSLMLRACVCLADAEDEESCALTTLFDALRRLCRICDDAVTDDGVNDGDDDALRLLLMRQYGFLYLSMP